MNPKFPQREVPQGLFGKTLEEAIEKAGLTLASFADQMGVSYEHIRRLQKSMAYPSRALFEKICTNLGLNPKEAREQLTADRLRHRFGDIHLKLAGRDPKLYDLEKMIQNLPPSQVHLLKGIVKGMLDANKR